MHDIKKNILEAYSDQPTFCQSVSEIYDNVIPYLESVDASETDYALLERLTVPERVIILKVVWEDDNGKTHFNTGYRVQFNSALGPYKGGLRFDPTVNIDVLKFLGFEQIFKNALTGLPLGAGKGGSDFDPRNKSDKEIQRFCVAYMTELHKYIGPFTDVPAGDIGVGEREIGYLYGAYKKIANRSDGVLTGKGLYYNGSDIRTEATGYGVVYFSKGALEAHGHELTGKCAVLSGAGNVATYAALKLIEEGATPLTLSDRDGYLYKAEGFTEQDVLNVMKHKKEHRRPLSEFELYESIEYHEGKVWRIPADIYMPCATQNEVSGEDAAYMVAHALLIAEGANMPSTPEAFDTFQKAGVLFVPAKAANAGGVAVSGLEMSQNASHVRWSRLDVDTKLQEIMRHIHDVCEQYGKREDGSIDYEKGADIGGFVRVFSTLKQLGW